MNFGYLFLLPLQRLLLLLLLVPEYENTMAWLLFPLAAAMNFGYLLLL